MFLKNHTKITILVFFLICQNYLLKASLIKIPEKIPKAMIQYIPARYEIIPYNHNLNKDPIKKIILLDKKQSITYTKEIPYCLHHVDQPNKTLSSPRDLLKIIYNTENNHILMTTKEKIPEKIPKAMIPYTPARYEIIPYNHNLKKDLITTMIFLDKASLIKIQEKIPKAMIPYTPARYEIIPYNNNIKKDLIKKKILLDEEQSITYTKEILYFLHHDDQPNEIESSAEDLLEIIYNTENNDILMTTKEKIPKAMIPYTSAPCEIIPYNNNIKKDLIKKKILLDEEQSITYTKEILYFLHHDDQPNEIESSPEDLLEIIYNTENNDILMKTREIIQYNIFDHLNDNLNDIEKDQNKKVMLFLIQQQILLLKEGLTKYRKEIPFQLILFSLHDINQPTKTVSSLTWLLKPIFDLVNNYLLIEISTMISGGILCPVMQSTIVLSTLFHLAYNDVQDLRNLANNLKTPESTLLEKINQESAEAKAKKKRSIILSILFGIFAGQSLFSNTDLLNKTNNEQEEIGEFLSEKKIIENLKQELYQLAEKIEKPISGAEAIGSIFYSFIKTEGLLFNRKKNKYPHSFGLNKKYLLYTQNRAINNIYFTFQNPLVRWFLTQIYTHPPMSQKKLKEILLNLEFRKKYMEIY